ncbi:MAG: hypothetical protein AAFY20_24280 [Cyanobacteria bacterium J06639_14]
MCFKQFRIALKNWLIKRKFEKIHAKYALRISRVDAQQKLEVANIWSIYQYDQIKDYIACIDFRLHFIASMLQPKVIEKIHKYKRVYHRKRDFKKIVALTEIVYQSNIENIDAELSKLIQAGKRIWIPWK